MLSSKPVVPGEMPLIGIGYKCNPWYVLSFVATSGVEITTLGIHFLSKHPEQFSNVSICTVTRPHIMSKFFGLVH